MRLRLQAMLVRPARLGLSVYPDNVFCASCKFSVPPLFSMKLNTYGSPLCPEDAWARQQTYVDLFGRSLGVNWR